MAEKLRGGTFLETYRKSGKEGAQFKAILHLEKALEHWKDLTDAMERYNLSVLPNQFDQQFSWRKHIKDAEQDIWIAKE
ncbi:MAG: hypothetical protein ACON5F_03145 [Jejuia sp.]